MTTQTKQTHTPGQLKVLDGALICEHTNQYGNFIVASCDREMTEEDKANIERLAHCWNCHDDLLSACEKMLKHISDGTLVRDISKDGDSRWAINMLGLVSDLNKLQSAIAKARGQ